MRPRIGIRQSIPVVNEELGHPSKIELPAEGGTDEMSTCRHITISLG